MFHNNLFESRTYFQSYSGALVPFYALHSHWTWDKIFFMYLFIFREKMYKIEVSSCILKSVYIEIIDVTAGCVRNDGETVYLPL